MEHFYTTGPQAPERDYAVANADDVELVGVETVASRALPTAGKTGETYSSDGQGGRILPDRWLKKSRA